MQLQRLHTINLTGLRPLERQIMTKSEIYKIRAQVYSAMHCANNNKVTYTPLIRMEWKKYGYIPVSAYNAA